MDLVLGKGIKYSCILMPRTSPFVFKLPSFLYKPQCVVLHRQFIHLGRLHFQNKSLLIVLIRMKLILLCVLIIRETFKLSASVN